jgi:hypothetical protein
MLSWLEGVLMCENLIRSLFMLSAQDYEKTMYRQ